MFTCTHASTPSTIVTPLCYLKWCIFVQCRLSLLLCGYSCLCSVISERFRENKWFLIIMIFSKVALVWMLSTASPFQGTKLPNFLSIEEVANVMTSKPSAATHLDIDSWGAFSILCGYRPLCMHSFCRLDWNGSISLQLRWGFCRLTDIIITFASQHVVSK